MTATDTSHFTDPEFAPIRAELCRLLVAKKRALGMGDRDDAEIIERADDIVWFLVARIGKAQAANDDAFLQRYRWLVAAFERLDQGKRIVGLDA